MSEGKGLEQSKELSAEERQKLIGELNQLTQEYTTLLNKPDKTPEEKERMGEIARRTDEIQEQLYS
jgi:ribonuclease HII